MGTPWRTALREAGEASLISVGRTALAECLGQPVGRGAQPAEESWARVTNRSTWERLLEAKAQAESSSDPTEIRRIQLLTQFVAIQMERRAAAPLAQERAALVASLSLDLDGERVPAARGMSALQNARQPERRAALARALVAVHQKVAPVARAQHRRAQDAAAELGGEDYVRWHGSLAGQDYEQLEPQTEGFLAATDDMAGDALHWLLRGRVDHQRGQAPAWFDLLAAARAVDLDEWLSPADYWKVENFLARGGLLQPPMAAGLVHQRLAAPPPDRSSLWVPVRVPHEVHLVQSLVPGLLAWRDHLRAFGQALCALGVDPDRPFEERWLGDPALRLGLATLLEHLLLNPGWGRRVLKLSREKSDFLARTAAAAILLDRRREAAQLRYTLAFYRNAPEADELFAELTRRATGTLPAPFEQVIRMRPELQDAEQLRATLFEAWAHQALREQFDEDWFLNPRAGAVLQQSLRAGGATDLTTLTTQSLGGSLIVDHVARRFEEVLG